MPGKEPKYKAYKTISLFTQLGFSLIFPVLLCAWGAGCLRDRFHLGNWVMLVGILFGTLTGVVSAAKLLMAIVREDEKKNRER